MQVFLSDRDQKVPHEESVVWLEDVSGMAYVREAFAIAHNRQRRLSYGGNGRLVGYTQLAKNAPRQDKDMFNRPEFLRRVFYLTDWDHDSQPRGTYQSHWPMEAVDPRSVVPSVASRKPEKGNAAQAELGIIERATRKFAEFIATKIAENPDLLLEVEWRDLERAIAQVFENLGFKVELTPPSKDGGKDIVISCRVSAQVSMYYIEVKHWKTGKKVSRDDVKNFIEVVMNNDVNRGLILSSSGYKYGGYAVTSEIERQKIRLGAKEKIVALCRTYVTTQDGVKFPTQALERIVFEDTQHF